MTLTFGQDKVFLKHCPICGMAIYEGDGGCPRYHKAVKKEKQPRTHGKSKSENRWNNG
jgi:uncharacterized Zn finger protein (UPF0148 family)